MTSQATVSQHVSQCRQNIVKLRDLFRQRVQPEQLGATPTHVLQTCPSHLYRSEWTNLFHTLQEEMGVSDYDAFLQSWSVHEPDTPPTLQILFTNHQVSGVAFTIVPNLRDPFWMLCYLLRSGMNLTDAVGLQADEQFFACMVTALPQALKIYKVKCDREAHMVLLRNIAEQSLLAIQKHENGGVAPTQQQRRAVTTESNVQRLVDVILPYVRAHTEATPPVENERLYVHFKAP